jgi:hypothetical protein
MKVKPNKPTAKQLEVMQNLRDEKYAVYVCYSATEAITVITQYLKLAKKQKINGETSDGYHTFKELYHHRAVLFSVVCSQFTDKAWKSKLHYDGTMFDNMFIVGIDTPNGQATYHYDIDPYWNIFNVRELKKSPEWDGHTSAEAIERIGYMSGAKLEHNDILQWFSRRCCTTKNI